jgi:hypothetical protein
MRVSLSSDLIAALSRLRAERKFGDPVESEHDAFRLFGGMGPCLYVTRAGDFLVGRDEFFDEPVTRGASDDEAITALVIGARRLGLSELLNFVPRRPSEASTCSVCFGKRWHPVKSTSGEWPIAICTSCHGRGWAVAEPPTGT